MQFSEIFSCSPVVYAFHNLILQDHVLCWHVAVILEPAASRSLLPFVVFTTALDFSERRHAYKKNKSL